MFFLLQGACAGLVQNLLYLHIPLDTRRHDSTSNLDLEVGLVKYRRRAAMARRATRQGHHEDQGEHADIPDSADAYPAAARSFGTSASQVSR